jgi:hypothetical protein
MGNGQMVQSPVEQRQLALQYAEHGQYSRAIRILRKMKQETPEDATVDYLLAACLLSVDEPEEARECLHRVLRQSPKHQDACLLLKEVQKQLESKSSRRLFYGNPQTQSPLTKNVCPNCQQLQWVGNYRCGNCGHLFLKRIFYSTLLIILVVIPLLIGLRYLFASIYGTIPETARIVNDAGNFGDQVLIYDTSWYCSGMGVGQRGGSGYQGEVRGKIKNIGLQTISKANVTLHLLGKQAEAAFVWFDILNFPSGEELEFVFPAVYPQYKAVRCEFHIQKVEYPEPSTQPSTEPVSVYVPESAQFPSYRFTSAQGDIIAEYGTQRFSSAGREYSFDTQNLFQFLIFFVMMLLSVFLAVLTVNFCDPDMKWNQDWQLELFASFCLVTGIIGINLFTLVLSIIPVVNILAFLMGVILQFALFFIIFKRSVLYTIILLIFFFCYLALFKAGYYQLVM